jgi:hypothetical protein
MDNIALHNYQRKLFSGPVKSFDHDPHESNYGCKLPST